jgi:hypothetical protein
MKNILLFEDFSVYEVEKVVSEDPKPEGPDEKLFVGEDIDRERAKSKAFDSGRSQGYPHKTHKNKLTSDGTRYKYQIVMSKKTQ